MATAIRRSGPELLPRQNRRKPMDVPTRDIRLAVGGMAPCSRQSRGVDPKRECWSSQLSLAKHAAARMRKGRRQTCADQTDRDEKQAKQEIYVA
jgi:hypothetical protein